MMSSVKMRYALWMALAILVLILDQWTKYLAVTRLDENMALYVLPVLNFTLHYNSGAAFSFLSDAGGWQRWFFTAIAVLVSSVLAVWIYRLPAQQKLLAASLALILGGAVGNVWDRVLLGYVIDFISVHYQQHYFPTFNIADAAISVGAALMLLDIVINPDNHKK